MRRSVLSLIAAIACLAAIAGDVNFTQWVNPRIGTGGHGHVFLGANVPFGYVQLGPTEPTRGWDWCSGYHDSDSVLIGFGHQHLSGTGIGDLGDIALLPVTRRDQREIIFRHDDETVSPGYYAITLHDGGAPFVTAELTATCRTGMHRYSFSPTIENCLLLLDLGQGIGWDTPREVKMKQLSPRMVAGYRHSSGWARDQKVFFVMEFSQDVKLEKLNGDTLGILTTPNNGDPLLVKTGLSAVSIENAIGNLMGENPGWDFDHVVGNAREAWDDELGKIDIVTDNEDDRTVFYTALYHTMVAPSVFNDICGEYRGADGEVHEGDFTNYTTLSLWDTYRAAHPLQTLIHREKQTDIAQTLLHIFEQQGKLPVWHLMGWETNTMVGNPAIPVVADAMLKGFGGFDKNLAYEAMRQSAMLDERGLKEYREHGYIPYEQGHENVSRTLEYGIADWALAQAAKQMGKAEDYSYFMKRSKGYRLLFDKRVGFVRGKSQDGTTWRTPFNPFTSTHEQDDFTEGNAWQYTWLVPHDVEGLVETFGGKRNFLHKFDSLFIVNGDLGADAPPDISGLIGQYAHGNEPSHHILYLYTMLGQPWKTADLVRKVLNEQYFDDYDGLSGNEDAGQMSAWYLLSSMGFYQVEPAGGRYVFGYPNFDEMSVSMGQNTLRIVVKNAGGNNHYIQRITLNGKPVKKYWIDHKELTTGGTLEYTMGPKPKKWY